MHYEKAVFFSFYTIGVILSHKAATTKHVGHTGVNRPFLQLAALEVDGWRRGNLPHPSTFWRSRQWGGTRAEIQGSKIDLLRAVHDLGVFAECLTTCPSPTRGLACAARRNEKAALIITNFSIPSWCRTMKLVPLFCPCRICPVKFRLHGRVSRYVLRLPRGAGVISTCEA
jgi:hypothetical protein